MYHWQGLVQSGGGGGCLRLLPYMSKAGVAPLSMLQSCGGEYWSIHF